MNFIYTILLIFFHQLFFHDRMLNLAMRLLNEKWNGYMAERCNYKGIYYEKDS